MAIQTDNLVMAALGVIDDQPPNSIQPKLKKGIHLRFGFAPERGFPWYGYYLFRRPHSASDRQCLQPRFNRDWKPGPWRGVQAEFADGVFSSDTQLVFLDQFPPTASPEFDLQRRKYLRFELPAGERAREFQVKLGMLGEKGGAGPRPTKKCVTFAKLKPDFCSAQFAVTKVEFTALGYGYDPIRNCEVRLIQGTAALICPGQLLVRPPVRASSVEIDLIQTTASAELVALGARENLVDRKRVSARKGKQTIKLSGGPIASVKIVAPKGGTFLLCFCYTAESPETPLLGPIKLRGFDGEVSVAETAISGHAGEIVTALLAADTMTSLEVESGPAALIDICTVAIAKDLARGWTPLVNQPLCLPVEHADYPCPGKPGTFAQAASLAQSRIHYGPAANWAGQNFANLNSMLKDLVVGGPAGGAMEGRTNSYPAATPDDPGLPKFHPLEAALLGSLNPAVAMMLGLYWVDGTAQPGATSDYLVMADHAGQFHGDPAAALAALTAVTPQTPLSSDVDVWITFGKKLEAEPPLAPPIAPRVFALPGAITGGNAPASSLPLGGRNMAGLTWQISATPDGSLLPDAPIGYHLWRAVLGESEPSSPPPSSAYDLLTADRLLVVTETPLPSNVTPERASDWPPIPVKAFDPGLPDGWYSYCLSAVDIFGRHSALGPPGAWLQWSPPPDPKPWYYIDPPADTQINSFAVRLLDKSAPPRVPGVEADALDPADKMLLRDAAFNTWWSAIEPTWWNSLGANQANVLPLRVRWKWTAAEMLQAPDTKEFRIYFNGHPGTDPPGPDHTNPANWQDRIYVVKYADPDHVSLTIDADGLPLRLYEVLLPVPGEAFPGVPLAPSETEPIVYAHVSVSAADDKPHTPDNPKWASGIWGNPGNEGKVGTPAKIYRVLRSKPPAPVAVDDSEKVWATKADYHSRSYYTFRWPKSGTYKTHIFRALDDTLFQTDWELRKQGAPSLNPTDLDKFPIPTWTQPTRDAIAGELNKLPIPAAAALFDETARATYAALSNNALRTLAGLPGNEAAFSQLTYLPLDPADTSNADRVGPDGTDTYTPNAALCAYTAELDGRATNRYFFRAAYVNAALTVGPLGPSSPPVYLPKVEPPRTPVITKILGGNRAITLTWAVNREPDLAEYRVYRTDDERRARDVRKMEKAGSVPQSVATIPMVAWIDSDNLLGGQTYFYRVTATDTSGNESMPSDAEAAVVVDTAIPPAPTWTEETWLTQREADNELFAWPPDGVIPPGHKPVLQLKWQSETPQPRFVVTRKRRGERGWSEPNAVANKMPAEPDTFVLVDPDADSTFESSYRLQLRSSSGVWSTEEAIIAVALPIPPPDFSSVEDEQ
ncbi:MAG: hypothetical protein V7609_3133 [Verrucomicrobiota bacterium]